MRTPICSAPPYRTKTAIAPVFLDWTRRLLVAGVAIIAIATATAEPKVVIVPVEPVDVQAVNWEGKKGEVFDGKRIQADGSMVLQGCTDITISCCDLRSIELALCERITIRNCWIHDSTKLGVSAYKCKGLRIEGCRFENVVSGLWATECEHVQFIGSFCRNVKGPFPRGQMAQLSNVTGSDNVIRGNYAINDKGKSLSEDVINLFETEGTEKSPVIVEDNYLVGDLKEGSEGKTKSGSGIMTGDFGGAWQICRRNVILSAGQCGIGVAGGSHITVEDNVILGLKSNVSNVGLYIWNQSKKPSDSVALRRNRVKWTNHDGEESSWWNGGGISKVEEKDNSFADDSVASSIPPPPSEAPMPPHAWTTEGPDGTRIARLPWKPGQK